jgi:hypothetical protein
MSNEKKIVGFKKFSEFKTESKIEEVDPSLPIKPEDDSSRPMLPNVPKPTTKVERTASRKSILPQDQTIIDDNDDDSDGDDDEVTYTDIDETKKEDVKMLGKVARFPKNTKASKAYNFLENVNISKKSIWYILVEQMDNELQCVKYNNKEGVDLNKFVNELKGYYITKNKTNKLLCEAIARIAVDGNDKYSRITNIAKVKVDDKLLITKITEDLIKLLSK